MNDTENSKKPDKPIIKDLMASLVVFLVALPLCMGIAIASGMPPAAGLVTGIIGGIVVGRLSGCPLQVSGPAAGLAVLVYEIIQKQGVEVLGVVVLIAGVLQVIAGTLRLGQWFRAVSPAVINGMLSGIGILILASQFHIMLDDKPRGSGIQNLLSIPTSLWECIRATDVTQTHVAGCVGILTLVVLLMWTKVPKSLKTIPAALVAVLIATVTSVILQLDITRVNLPDQISELVRVPDFSKIKWDAVLLMDALALGFIASAETLLSATAVDRMHNGPRTRYDKELAGQGIGNIICGALGALPMTGVIVRSSVNVQAGAQTRLSAMLHGVWLLLMVVLFPRLIEYIPTAALAALLVYTGFKLVNWKAAKGLWQVSKSEFLIYVITVATIVGEDLLTGVLTGVALSVAKLIYIFARLDIRMDGSDGRYTLWLTGSATFLSLPKLAAALEKVPPKSELHVHLERLDYVDHACLDLLMNWESQQKQQGGALIMDWGDVEASFRGSLSGNQGQAFSNARQAAGSGSGH